MIYDGFYMVYILIRGGLTESKMVGVIIPPGLTEKGNGGGGFGPDALIPKAPDFVFV